MMPRKEVSFVFLVIAKVQMYSNVQMTADWTQLGCDTGWLFVYGNFWEKFEAGTDSADNAAVMRKQVFAARNISLKVLSVCA